MSEKSNIFILGAGWLGKAFGRELSRDGWRVAASTTSPERLPELRAAGLEPCLLELSTEGLKGELSPLKNASVILLSFPPNLRSGPAGNYLARVQQLLKVLPEGKKLLMVSSTGVLPNPERVVDESDADAPDTEKGKEMREAELSVLNAGGQQATVIRFGGLTGAGRNPVKYFAGKTDLPKGNHPVNLIHQDDCIGVLRTVLEKEAWGKAWNAVAPEHPTHREYYPAEAARRELGSVEYAPGNSPDWKIVSSSALQEELGYAFRHPNPMEFPLD